MKKILHVTPIYWDNWAYQENILAEYQARCGYDIYVIAPAISLAKYRNDLSGIENEYILNGVNVTRLKLKWNIINRFYWFEGLFEKIKEIKPDIIMLHGLQMLPIFILRKYKISNPNCDIYADVHSDERISAKNLISKIVLHKIFWRFIIMLNISIFNTIYFVRPSVKDFIKKYYKIPECKLQSLLMGSEYPPKSYEEREKLRLSIREKYSIPNDAILLCTGGKLDLDKNISLLIRTVSDINDSRIQLVVFGEVLPSYKEIFNNLLINSRNTNFIGWLDAKNIYDLFCASDYAIFLGGHSVLWEQAIGFGVPCIFQYSKDREYLDLNGNVLFLFNNSFLELKQLLLLFRYNPELVKKMAITALTEGPKKFSYEKIIDKLLNNWGLIK